MRRLRNLALLVTAVLAPFYASGCLPFWMVPIPIPPWVTEKMEEKCEKNDYRTAVMPPIQDGVPEPTCEDPPSVRQVLRA